MAGYHNPGAEPASLMFPALADGFFPTEPPGKPLNYLRALKYVEKDFEKTFDNQPFKLRVTK